MGPLICNCVIYLSTDVPFNNNYPEQGSLTKERVRLGEILQDKENIIQSQRLDNVVFIFPQNFSRDIKTILSIIFLSSTQHVSALALLTCDIKLKCGVDGVNWLLNTFSERRPGPLLFCRFEALVSTLVKCPPPPSSPAIGPSDGS